MRILYIYQQTQIGDHILCYPIVKHYAALHDKVYVFARPLGERHINNINRLYSSLPNVKLILSPDHNHTLNFMKINPDNNYLIFGHEDYREQLSRDPNTQFDKYFYEEAKVPFENKWSEFYLERDIEKEKDVFCNVFGLKDGEEYVFLQEDETRGYVVNRKYINSNIKIIETAKYPDINIFDFLYTIENAKEVHEINSSFLTLIDMLQLKEDGLFYHKYVRPTQYEQPHLKLNWKVL